MLWSIYVLWWKICWKGHINEKLQQQKGQKLYRIQSLI